MMQFGTPEPAARAAVVQAAIAPERARIDKNADGSYKLIVDDPFDRAWRRVGLALDRAGFTVVDRDRSRGVYFVRYGDPDALAQEGERRGLARPSCSSGRPTRRTSPSSTRSSSPSRRRTAWSACRTRAARPTARATSEKILALLKDQLK